MSRDKKQEGEAAGTKWQSKRLWIVTPVILIAAIMCLFAWKVRRMDPQAIDEQLAAIDAEFAIPDSENAAAFYRQLFRRTTDREVELRRNVGRGSYREPWTADEYPEDAAVLYKHRALIQQWLGNLQFEKARFSVDPPSPLGFWRVQMGMQAANFILSGAAANDLAEGRPDAAYDKYRCLMQMARHAFQQPGTGVKRIGRLYERTACRNIRMAAMHDEITPENLRTLESILEIPMEGGDEFSQITARVERLLDARARSKMSTIERLKDLWYGPRERRKQEESRREGRIRAEADRRATIVLIALRRHKERAGAWPDTLEQIEPKLPDQTLVDPQNNCPFVYKRNRDSFVLYSKGPSGIDEGGAWRGPAGNHPMWPRRITENPATEK